MREQAALLAAEIIHLLSQDIKKHNRTVAALEEIAEQHERRLFELENRRPQ